MKTAEFLEDSNLLSGVRWVIGTNIALRSAHANNCDPLCQPFVAPCNSSSNSARGKGKIFLIEVKFDPVLAVFEF